MGVELLKDLIFLSGVGHILLCFGSLLIPRLLNWKSALGALDPLLRQMFWTYAAYILVINFSFGVISIAGSSELLSQSFLARSVTLFISLYWIGRILIQFFYFDRTSTPKGLIYALGELALVGLFIIFSIVYALAFLYNVEWM